MKGKEAGENMSIRKAWCKKGKELLDEIKDTKVTEDELAIWYLGQCGFVVKQRKIIYIDPVLNDMRDEHGNSRRFYEPPFEPEMAEADYVFCTHAHSDHMARETVLGIYENNKTVKFVLPGACKEIAAGWGISENSLIEARANQPLALSDMTVHGISTAHPTHRREEDGKEWSLAFGFDLNGIFLLHMGDTYITDRLLCDLRRLPAPHVFLTPVNGADYFRDKKNIIGNMSAREAAFMAEELSADLTIPMHYDMIKSNTCNPFVFLEELWDIAPWRKTALPALGERIIYKK